MQIVASSVSGVLAHMRRGTVDFAMGVVLTVGGFLGSGLGVWVFHEPFDRARLLGFALIWAALLIYSVDGWRRSRVAAAPA